MRTVMLTCALALAASLGAAQAAELSVAPRAYRAAPPPARYVDAGPPPAYLAPPGIMVVPQGPAYVVPQPLYQPGSEYFQAPFLVDARRYTRHCFHEQGQPKCVLWERW